MIAKDKIVGNIRIYRNKENEICIMDDLSMCKDEPEILSFDECMAEKICKHIMEVAKEIRKFEGVKND